MKTLLASATALLIATSAFAQSAAEKTGVNSLAGIAPKTQDFVMQAASSDMFELESSKLALERADAATKTFAQQMIDDHGKTSSEMKALLASVNPPVTAPTEMMPKHQEMLEELRGLQGQEFTDQYHDDQEDVHEEAVDLFKRYGEEGENAELKAWSAQTLPALQHHLEMAEKLDD
jgi:putative membrane protein